MSSTWLEERGLTTERLASVLGGLSQRQVDFADLYLQDQILESWSLEDGIVRDAGYSHDQGAGIRVNT